MSPGHQLAAIMFAGIFCYKAIGQPGESSTCLIRNKVLKKRVAKKQATHILNIEPINKFTLLKLAACNR